MSPAPASHESASLDVLIVDDDELVCARLESLLAGRGIGTLAVHTLEEARQALKAVYFPLVILDRHLADGDAIELCRTYRAQHHHASVRIVFLSGQASECDVRAGLGAGADDYVSKSCRDEELLARIEQLHPRTRQ